MEIYQQFEVATAPGTLLNQKINPAARFTMKSALI